MSGQFYTPTAVAVKIRRLRIVQKKVIEGRNEDVGN
jgi:hypothetical protein